MRLLYVVAACAALVLGPAWVSASPPGQGCALCGQMPEKGACGHADSHSPACPCALCCPPLVAGLAASGPFALYPGDQEPVQDAAWTCVRLLYPPPLPPPRARRS
ncbi:MAG TPA: hypothetical protein VGG34_15580 [Opitutaceae bacterium]